MSMHDKNSACCGESLFVLVMVFCIVVLLPGMIGFAVYRAAFVRNESFGTLEKARYMTDCGAHYTMLQFTDGRARMVRGWHEIKLGDSVRVVTDGYGQLVAIESVPAEVSP